MLVESITFELFSINKGFYYQIDKNEGLMLFI